MTIHRSKTFNKGYRKLPQNLRNKADRQLRTLINNWQHPSLSTKRIKGYSDIWEVRVDYHNRITFQVADDMLMLRTIGPHDVLKNP